MDAGPHIEAGRGHSLPEAQSIGLEPVAQAGRGRENLEGAKSASDDRGRERIREQVRPGLLPQVLDYLFAAGDAAARSPAEGLSEGGGDYVHSPFYGVVLARAPSGLADEAGGVGIVDHHEGVVALGEVAYRAEPG